MMTKDELLDELYVQNRIMNNVPYAAPEAFEAARNFIQAVENDLGMKVAEILEDPDRLDAILDDKAKSYRPKYFGRFIKVASTHNNLDSSYEGGFDTMPMVGRSFEFIIAPIAQGRNLMTSKVQDILQLGEDEILIKTKNSTYKVVYHQ